MKDIKRFRDRNTGKNYVKLTDGVILEVVNDKDLKLEEISTEDYTYRHGFMCYSNHKIVDVVKDVVYKLKDTLDVPVGDKIITFVVEHINKTDNYKDVYFVAKDIVGYSSINEMEKFLDDFTDKMPTELVDVMKVIEHVANVNDEVVTFRRKVNLISYANLYKTDYHFGKDDFLFDGLQSEAKRYKNDKDIGACWFWTCSPFPGCATFFMNVFNGGYLSGSDPGNVIGVVPCFSIRIYK